MVLTKRNVSVFIALLMFFSVFSVFMTSETFASTNGNNVKAVYKYLRNTEKFTKQAALASVAVMDIESGVNPTAQDKQKIGYGVFQWSYGRKAALMKQKNYKTLKTQEKFYISELKQMNLYNKIKKSKNTSDCIKTITKKYTKPGIDYSQRAISRANTLKSKYKLNY